MSECENRHSREGGNPQAFTAEYAEERRVKTLTTEAQRHRELPKGWVKQPLGEICIVARGGSPRPIKKFLTSDPNGVNWIKIGDASRSSKYIFETKEKIIPEGVTKSRFVKEGDFLLSNSMSFGRPYIMKTSGCIHDGWLVLSDKYQLYDQDYLFYVLGSVTVYQQFSKLASGSTVKNLNIDLAKQAIVPLPPLNEQKRIVAKIEDLQARSKAAREALAAVPKLVEQFKQSVLAAAFRGDLTKTWREQHPDVEPAEQLLARIRSERRTKWETDQLAAYEAKGKNPPKNWQTRYKEPAPVDMPNPSDLPEGWCWSSFDELLFSSQNGLSKRSSKSGDPLKVLRLTDISNGCIDTSEPREILLDVIEKEQYELFHGDLICIRVNGSADLVGRMLTFSEEEYWAFCDHFIRFKLVGILPSEYVSEYFETFSVRAMIEQSFVSSAGQKTVSQGTIKCIPVPLSSVKEQQQITQRIESLFTYADSILEQAKASLAELDRLDQSILAKAFRGELVPQDPNDEPASVLLERIKAERAKVTPVKRSRKKAMA